MTPNNKLNIKIAHITEQLEAANESGNPSPRLTAEALKAIAEGRATLARFGKDSPIAAIAGLMGDAEATNFVVGFSEEFREQQTLGKTKDEATAYMMDWLDAFAERLKSKSPMQPILHKTLGDLISLVADAVYSDDQEEPV